MDYCTAHFGKPLNNLKLADIQAFFVEERTETDQIEFKSIHNQGNLNEKFMGIQKSICAFLNSSGGLLIWGAPDGQKVDGRKEKIFKGELTYFDQAIEKDLVVSKISDSIIPLPRNIRVNILSDEGTSIVIIEVDASDYSPHQNQNTYYMRIDGQSKPAPHHYIEALFKKISYPNIEAFLKITNLEVVGGKYQVWINLFFFNWSALQNEENLSFRVITDGIFDEAHRPNKAHNYSMQGHEYFKDNAKDIFYFGEPIVEEVSILFNPYEVGRKGKRGRLSVSFGGKYSPRKSCEYFLDLSNMYLEDPNIIIIKQHENILSKDLQDAKGATKQSILDLFLTNRKI